jgi:hypothetical protein
VGSIGQSGACMGVGPEGLFERAGAHRGAGMGWLGSQLNCHAYGHGGQAQNDSAQEMPPRYCVHSTVIQTDASSKWNGKDAETGGIGGVSGCRSGRRGPESAAGANISLPLLPNGHEVASK